MPRLSPETQRRVDLSFPPNERAAATTLLIEQCGNNLPFLDRSDEYQLERVRFAALKLSEGDLIRLREAIELAQIDWRDLLMAAGFAHSITEHEMWLPKNVYDELTDTDLDALVSEPTDLI